MTIMRRRDSEVWGIVALAGLLYSVTSLYGVDAFGIRQPFAFSQSGPKVCNANFGNVVYYMPYSTALLAKKKKSPASAALETLESLDLLDDDAPLSVKEQMELSKQQKKVQKKGNAQNIDDAPQAPVAKKLSKKEQLLAKALASEDDKLDEPPAPINKKELRKREPDQVVNEHVNGDASPAKSLSKKEQMLAKALELEALDASAAVAGDAEDDAPKLSKKELKELKKKEQKQLEKEEKKQQKKQAGAAARALEDDESIVIPAATDTEADETDEEAEYQFLEEDTGPTLEDKVRKDRPPPRIRVMESSQPGYTSLRLEGVSVTFRNQEVLKDVTWGVQTGDRIGLVGANGAGKTTQLRILAGELEPTAGDVVKSSNDLRVSMLRQEFVDELVPTRTLREEMLSVFKEETRILEEIKSNEDELANADGTDPDRMQQILDRMQELQNEAEDKEVYVLESRVKKVMDLMGFTEDEGDDLVASFSGGWKMRIGLGKVLLTDPNVLLLDEPTNHLDLESVEWLEAFLREQNIPMIIVSHDREFLDQVCTKIVDAEGGVCTEYDGNYSRFLQLKKARMDSWTAAFNAQEKKIKEERQWISKFRAKQPQAVKQREAKLEKLIKSEDYVKKPPFVGKPFRFRFPDAPRLSPEVAEVKSLSHSYVSETTRNRLFEDVDLFVEKGDRIAVVGPNGAGKSTLLRLLIGREEPESGSACLIGQNVVMNYFEQNQADALDLEKTVLQTLQDSSSGQSYNELRALLGQFLFKGDAVEKKVRFLSGGEKARLSLCCMMLKPANFLILDEPTNHLDIPAKEMLEEALQHFQGAVMVVSHDRYFISQVATTIVAIEEKKLTKYQGDYKFYMSRSKEFQEKIESRYVNGVKRIESAPIIDMEEIEKNSKKKNFGGAATANLVTRKDKGIKNAKRQKAT